MKEVTIAWEEREEKQRFPPQLRCHRSPTFPRNLPLLVLTPRHRPRLSLCSIPHLQLGSFLNTPLRRNEIEYSITLSVSIDGCSLSSSSYSPYPSSVRSTATFPTLSLLSFLPSLLSKHNLPRPLLQQWEISTGLSSAKPILAALMSNTTIHTLYITLPTLLPHQELQEGVASL